MGYGTVDVFTSRRTNFLDCEYWIVAKGEEQKDKSILMHEKQKSGVFSASIDGAEENSNSVIAQTLLFDSNSVTISTDDDVSDIKKNTIILMVDTGLIWRVDRVSKLPIRTNYQFDNMISYKYYLDLRR